MKFKKGDKVIIINLKKIFSHPDSFKYLIGKKDFILRVDDNITLKSGLIVNEKNIKLI